MGRRVTQGALAIAVCLALGSTVRECGAIFDSGGSWHQRDHRRGPRQDHAAAALDAIIGGDIRAIIGGDRSKTTRPLRSDAIIGGDIRAIIGGDRSKTTRPLRSDAIIGGDIRAIIGGDRSKTTRPLRSDAIIGGDIRAIIGGEPQQDATAVAAL